MFFFFFVFCFIFFFFFIVSFSFFRTIISTIPLYSESYGNRFSLMPLPWRCILGCLKGPWTPDAFVTSSSLHWATAIAQKERARKRAVVARMRVVTRIPPRENTDDRDHAGDHHPQQHPAKTRGQAHRAFCSTLEKPPCRKHQHASSTQSDELSTPYVT
eukprot:gnl/TRDRNA2_/TRDRNA2_34532_c0_seq1.p1 gnl/TRDRNA2_/TRDRNA2_34532_c0~~gnl/TRDRNA2_/TRDRNA2_34532_c0_seq1.p1  ORF type:complete len:159 (+),score=7.35 gnl/TRDRNA2_/TRDRNA2_34532_c0_seq1:1-477(+)